MSNNNHLRSHILHYYMDRKLYREKILDHYRNPNNCGKPTDINSYNTSKVENLSCGDEITVFIKIKDDKIKDIKYEIEGCAISTASASLISKELIGEHVSKLKNADQDFVINKLLKVEITPMRMKCALLARDALLKCVEKN